MPSITYEPIATTTFSSTAGSFTFSSIPQTYKTLRVVSRSAFSAANYILQVRFNGVTGNTMQVQHIYAVGTSTKSGPVDNSTSQFNIDSGMSSGSTSNPTLAIIDFPNYRKTGGYGGWSANTSDLRADPVGNQAEDHAVGGTDYSSAITSLVFIAGGTTFAIGDTLTLYGLGA
jgi:hypothetical protein